MFSEEIRAAASHFALDPQLVQAIIEQESSGNPFAWNPEPRYKYYWDVKKRKPFRSITLQEASARFPPHDFPALAGDPDQEWWAQSASWGLMQVMGAVAREHGCMEPFLTRLCDPLINLTVGCSHLSQLFTWAGQHTDLNTTHDQIQESVLAAYNGGRVGNSPLDRPLRSGAYAMEVLGRYAAIQRIS